MPGASAYAAYEAFLKPVQRAVACLGSDKVGVSAGGKQQLETTHVLFVNDGNGMELSGGLHLDLSIHYQIRQVGRRDFKVATVSYEHELTNASGVGLFAMHWHPEGNSDYLQTHLHLNPTGSVAGSYDRHYPVSRQSAEDAIEWAIQLGAHPARKDWQTILDSTRTSHYDFASWTGRDRV